MPGGWDSDGGAPASWRGAGRSHRRTGAADDQRRSRADAEPAQPARQHLDAVAVRRVAWRGDPRAAVEVGTRRHVRRADEATEVVEPRHRQGDGDVAVVELRADVAR